MFKIYLIKIIRIFLSLIFKFDYWHSSPRQNRDYVTYTNKVIKSKIKKNFIADLGCGLGDVTYNLQNSHIDYYDNSKELLRYLKFTKLFKKKKNFYLFDFNNDNIVKKYDIIILLNFLHNIESEILLKKLSNIYIDNLNKFGFLIFDIIDQNKNYKYNHKLKVFFEKNKIKRVLISDKMKFNRRIIVVMKN